MTEKQLIKKVKECLKSDKALIEKLIHKAIISGAMDIKGAENDFRLPKQLLSAIYKEMSRQYMPFGRSKEVEKEIENIYIRL